MKIVLELKELIKYYGKILGVKNLSLELKEGEIFGFIGPNGAGKSTTIRSIMHLINKTSGQIIINGKPFEKDDIATKMQIGYLPSEVSLYDDLTVKEMLDYHESFYKANIHARRQELIEKLKLDETKKVEDLSLGNLKKLGIVLAFMHSPKLLILDEPTSGLDPIMQQVFYDLLQEEKKKNTTIFYSTHILSEVAKVCDRVGIIKNGQLLKVESVKELSNKNLVFVTITSKDIDKIAHDLKITPEQKEEQTIKFRSNKDFNTLIKKLSNYKIDKLLIEEATLEDMFLHYYE